MTPQTLVETLAAGLTKNGLQPEPNATWQEAAKLLEADFPPHEIELVIAFTCDNPFWSTRVKSMPQLRQHYRDIRLEAQSKGQLGSPRSKSDRSLDEGGIRQRVAHYRDNIVGAELLGERFLDADEVETLCHEYASKLRNRR